MADLKGNSSKFGYSYLQANYLGCPKNTLKSASTLYIYITIRILRFSQVYNIFYVKSSLKIVTNLNSNYIISKDLFFSAPDHVYISQIAVLGVYLADRIFFIFLSFCGENSPKEGRRGGGWGNCFFLHQTMTILWTKSKSQWTLSFILIYMYILYMYVHI